MEAIKGAIAQDTLREASAEDVWGSSSLFVNEEDANKHVKPYYRGRQMRAEDGIRYIKERNEKEQILEMEKAVKEQELAARKAEKTLKKLEEDVEKKRRREEREQKAVENKAKKAKEALARERKWLDALAKSKKLKGRMPRSLQASQAASQVASRAPSPELNDEMDLVESEEDFDIMD
ncbi:hypothetical protein EG329_002979 [Mollisiaceae sp. DMI_Dod_QoI]|nr:hypothetical protein EG329_002979 [Helotiales sp. DMI_Dod_QoI]